jgi:hypothetical protein
VCFAQRAVSGSKQTTYFKRRKDEKDHPLSSSTDGWRLVLTLPVLILYAFFQRYIIQSISMMGNKG